jgi:hypothetical protein
MRSLKTGRYNQFLKLLKKLSQFWYDDETAETLAKELLHGATSDTVIAIISAPSVYAKIRVFQLFTRLTLENAMSYREDLFV